MNAIAPTPSPDAHVIYGAAYDDALGDELRVTVVATGLSRQGRHAAAPHRCKCCAPAPTTCPAHANHAQPVAPGAAASRGPADCVDGQPSCTSVWLGQGWDR